MGDEVHGFEVEDVNFCL